MKYNIINFLQGLFIILFTPLFVGIIKKIKANLRGYKGPSIFQIYYDYIRLFQKSNIRSENSSFITEIGPILSLAASITVAFMIPVFYSNDNTLGNLFIIVFIIGIIKFFNTLIGLDCCSTFGGMGSSRELFLSMLVEPVMFFIILFVYFETKTFNIFNIASINAGSNPYNIGHILAAVAFFIVLLTENARVPIDNPETHLELTMIHEAMILDLSGKDLAFIELASQIKLVAFITIFINIFMPVGLGTSLSALVILKAILFYIVKVILVLLIISIVEIIMAKSRLFRVPELLATAFSIVVAAFSLNYFI